VTSCTITCPQQSPDAVKAAAGRLRIDEQSRRRLRCVWFEAWRYQHEAVPIVALLHEMRAQLAFYKRGFNQLQKIASVTVHGALLSMEDLTKKIGIQASKIEQAGRQWEAEHLAAVLPSNTLRMQLEAAIKALLPNYRNSRVAPTPTARTSMPFSTCRCWSILRPVSWRSSCYRQAGCEVEKVRLAPDATTCAGMRINRCGGRPWCSCLNC
jgi:hypothetical protein